MNFTNSLLKSTKDLNSFSKSNLILLAKKYNIPFVNKSVVVNILAYILLLPHFNSIGKMDSLDDETEYKMSTILHFTPIGILSDFIGDLSPLHIVDYSNIVQLPFITPKIQGILFKFGTEALDWNKWVALYTENAKALDNVNNYWDVPILDFLKKNEKLNPTDKEWWINSINVKGFSKWLSLLKYNIKGSSKASVWAAVNGQLEILKWIREKGGEFTNLEADYAAANGHLEVLKWIRANGGSWTSYAVDHAAKNGHLEVLKWIIENDGELTDDNDISYAADYAAAGGYLDILKYILENGGYMTSDAADMAAENGNLDVLKWIHEEGDVEWTEDAAYRAAENGHLDVLKYIHENGGEWSHMAADRAAENGHLDVLKYIRANGGPWTKHAANAAAKNGHLDVLKWILANNGD